jgi:hypothetical protein
MIDVVVTDQDGLRLLQWQPEDAGVVQNRLTLARIEQERPGRGFQPDRPAVLGHRAERPVDRVLTKDLRAYRHQGLLRLGSWSSFISGVCAERIHRNEPRRQDR